jgi:Na+/glutamate symporter
MYVVTWEIIYFNFLPDFGEKYAAHMLEKARAAGASAEQLAAEAEKMNEMKSILNNPLLNAAFTLLEPLPVGLVLTLVSAAILRKRYKEPQTT